MNIEGESNEEFATFPETVLDSDSPEKKRMKIEEEEEEACMHESIRGLCSQCGKRIKDKDRNICVVMDFDHILLNSARLENLLEEERFLESRIDSDALIGQLFKIDSLKLIVKLRPSVRSFLRQAGELFEIHVCTLASREYAREMVKLIDPRGTYISSIIHCVYEKKLDTLGLPGKDIIILDDKEWTQCFQNVILMEQYHFFASSLHQFHPTHRSLSQRHLDEHESEGALACILQVLKKVCKSCYFVPDDLDVGLVLKDLFMKILKGCNIFFGNIGLTDIPMKDHHLWKKAEELGAKCSENFDSLVTSYVISMDGLTTKSTWALAVHNSRYLVTPAWLEAAYYLWMYFSVDGYPINRIIIDEPRSHALRGCKILFTAMFAFDFPPEEHYLWKIAEQHGAVCTTEIDASVTHVVTFNRLIQTEESAWAVKEKKYLLRVSWIMESDRNNRKDREEWHDAKW